jgi:rhamnose transport system permease protein
VAKGYELSIIAACVIGGVSIAGGIGTVAGTVLGALFLGLVNSALPVINISPFGRWQFRGRQLFWLWFSMPGANADKAELS